jgi:hypothetical protein
LEHDGWREEQLNTNSGIPDPETYRRANFDTTQQRLATMEKLLDLPSDGDLSSRLERLKPYFEKQ